MAPLVHRPSWAPPGLHFPLVHAGVLSAIEQPVVAADRAGAVLYWNHAAERLSGWSQHEALGRHVVDLVLPRVPEETVRELVETTRRGGTWRGELALRRRDGAPAPTRVACSALRDPLGDVSGVVAVASEAPLPGVPRAGDPQGEDVALCRALFEGSQVAMTVRDAEGRLVRWNRKAAVGFDGLTFLDVTHPDDREQEAARFRQLVSGERDAYDVEKRYVVGGGEERWVRVRVVAVRDSRGGFRFAVAMGEDVSERRAMEEALRRSQEELRRLAAHHQSAREGEQERIARELHDELGQALSGLKLDLTALRRRAARGAAAMEPQDTERVEGMVAAVDGLLDALRRISLELRPAVLDALGLEAAAEWLVEELGRRTGLEVRLSADLGGREVDRDRAVALYRILQEALTNVARHAEARRVQVQLGAEGDEVVLVVRDDGRGLPAEGSLPPSRLGLVGMRERAHAFGGFTAVASQPGQGTRIEARLPLETTRGEPAEP